MNKPQNRSQQLYDDLNRRIEAREVLPGDMLQSESQLGASYHISRQTVRRVLERLGSRGLVEKRPGVGTFVRGDRPPQPDAVREFRIGVDTPGNSPHHYSRDLLKALNELDGELLRFYFHFVSPAAAEHGDFPENLDAMLVTALPAVSPALQRRAEETSTPLILVNRTSSDPNISYVGIDHRREADFAVSTLFAHGHRDVLAVCGCETANQLRAAGWRDAYRRKFGEVPEKLLLQCGRDGNFTPAVESVLNRADFSAVFFTGNYMYYRFSQDARTLGSRKLEMLDMLCFDLPDPWYCPKEYVCSYLRMPFEKMARRIADRLLRPDAAKLREFLPCELVLQRRMPRENNQSYKDAAI